ncbi:MAG: HAD hydrolase-like protein, partial [Oscillospiraceae bacterium]|nr:HAD hydrolase-like protein [Oscillospiraceae bacterium]
MNKIENFVWDFDGTLFDTYPAIVAIMRQSLQHFGYDSQPQEIMYLLLESVAFARVHYAERFGIDPQDLKQQMDIRWEQYFAQPDSKPMEGVEGVLRQVIATGRKNYIFTNRKWGETVDLLKKFGMDVYFQDIIGQDSEGFAW